MARIKDYPEVQSMDENDYLAIDRPNGVKKIKKSTLLGNIPQDVEDLKDALSQFVTVVTDTLPAYSTSVAKLIDLPSGFTYDNAVILGYSIDDTLRSPTLRRYNHGIAIGVQANDKIWVLNNYSSAYNDAALRVFLVKKDLT